MIAYTRVAADIFIYYLFTRNTQCKQGRPRISKGAKLCIIVKLNLLIRKN